MCWDRQLWPPRRRLVIFTATVDPDDGRGGVWRSRMADNPVVEARLLNGTILIYGATGYTGRTHRKCGER